jgi:hypothetical protein
MEATSQSLGVAFGIIYDGNMGLASLDGGLSDAAWMSRAESRMVDYETEGGNPDQVIFQSWEVPPRLVLPETDPTAFTYLIDRYFRVRTDVTLQAAFVDGGSISFQGVLSDFQGNPIAGAPVVLSATPIDGPGAPDTLTLAGTVPAGASQAVLALRINTECRCNQDAALVWFGASYQENAGPNRVLDGDLSSGATGWHLGGSSNAILLPSELGSGNELAVNVAAGQTVLVNTPAMAVTPGAPFDAAFRARVPPASVGSGFFGVVFRDGAGHELSRVPILLRAAAVAGSTTTAADGTYSVVFSPPPGDLSISSWFGGDSVRWPARSVALLSAE